MDDRGGRYIMTRYRIPAGGKASPSGLKGDPPRAPSAARGVGGEGSGECCGSRGGVDSTDGDGDGGEARALRPLSEPVADGREAVVVMVFTSHSDAEAQTESGEVRRSLRSVSSSNSREAGSLSSRPLSSSVSRESALRSPGVEGVGNIEVGMEWYGLNSDISDPLLSWKLLDSVSWICSKGTLHLSPVWRRIC